MLAGGLRCLPPGYLHRLLIPWQLVSPRGRMEVAHTVNYGLVSDSYTHFLFFLLGVSHWVQPIVNQQKGFTQGRERQEVTLGSGYCCPFHDTNFVSYLVTQEILKICLNYFHYRNFSSPSVHLQQSFMDLSQPNTVDQWRVLFKTSSLPSPPSTVMVSSKSVLGGNKIIQLNYRKLMCWLQSCSHWIHVLVIGKSTSSFNWPCEESDKEKRHSWTWHSQSGTCSLLRRDFEEFVILLTIKRITPIIFIFPIIKDTCFK